MRKIGQEADDRRGGGSQAFLAYRKEKWTTYEKRDSLARSSITDFRRKKREKGGGWSNNLTTNREKNPIPFPDRERR